MNDKIKIMEVDSGNFHYILSIALIEDHDYYWKLPKMPEIFDWLNNPDNLRNGNVTIEIVMRPLLEDHHQFDIYLSFEDEKAATLFNLSCR